MSGCPDWDDRLFFIITQACKSRFMPKFARPNKRTVMKRKRIILLSGIALTVIAICITVPLCLLLNHPIKTSQTAFLYIDDDDTADSVCMKLEKQFHAERLEGFRLLAALKHYEEHVHTGAYKLSAEENTFQLFQKLNNGHQTPVKLIVPSVRTIGRMAATVSRQIMADSTELASLLNDSTHYTPLGFNRATLPALFLPNTYEVYWNMNAEEFLKRIKKEYDRFWNTQRTEKAKAIGLTPIEVSTLASIVEEETANKSEMPTVAGLYLNRLRIGMPLQADPTVKFALQDFGLRRILLKHLEADSPYNTYKNQGLPPGPIRIPSIHAIESVLNPSRHDYLYMCAKEDFSGTHNFARTLSQHQANARRYQQALNRRNIR